MNDDQSIAPRILIVDDEEIIRVALRAILEKSGYAIDEAGSALEGLALIDQSEYAMVISDHKMPGMSGLEFLAQVRTLCPETVRILTTVAFNVASHIDEINRAEVFQFIIKPWEAKTLLETVKRGTRRFNDVHRSESLQTTSLAATQNLASTALDLESSRNSLEEENRVLKSNWIKTIQATHQALKTVCPWVATQTQRVQKLCQAMAAELKLSDEDREILDLSSQLFDIGMVSVPPEVALKWRQSPQQLTPAERDIIQQHPIVAANLVQYEGAFQRVTETIRSHHERMDGSGFPDGKRREDIPPLARYLGAAVALCETSHSELEALEKLRQTQSGFDVQALDAIERVISTRALETA